MKKGILFRLLVIVLVCAMLFGLMGFTTIEPQDGEDGVQNEVVPEQPTGSQGEEPKGEEPGEKPSEEPGEKPGEEPQNPELIKISIASVKGGTLALDKEKLPEGAEVEEDGSAVYAAEGTVLNFVATAAKEGVVSSEFVAAYVDDKTDEAGPVKVVDGTEADGVYTFSVTTGENPITVSAEFFGIESVEVSNANVWVNASNKDGGKIVTVKTFGAKNVVLSADGDTITATDKGDGKFTALVAAKDYQLDEKGKDFTVKISNPDNGLKAETKVKVCKIDTVAPEINGQPKVTKSKKNSVTKYTYTLNFTDDVSGINKGSIEIKYYTRRGETKTYTPESLKWTGNTLEFVTKKNYNFHYEIEDNAGNMISDPAANPADTVAPFIVDMSITPGALVDGTDNVWWAGAGSTLTVKATDGSKVEKISLGEKTVEKEIVEIEEDTYSADFTIADLKIEAGETFAVTAVDSKNNTSEAKNITINYDPDAPVIERATYHSAPENGNWLKGFINKITGGHLFNESFDIKFVANDGKDNAEKGTMASGIASADYMLVEGKDTFTQEDIDNGTWSSEGVNFDQRDQLDQGDVVVKIAKDFRGCVVLRVKDLAGNVAYATVGFDEGAAEKTKGELITNEATVNDTSRESEDFNPSLTVMANTTKVNENGETISVAYNGKNWTQSVDFTICARKDEAKLPTRDDVKKDATEGSPAETIKYTYRYADAAPTIKATYGGTTKTEINVTPANSTEYQYKANIGNSGVNVSYAGNVVFTASYKIIETATTYVDGKVYGTPVYNEVDLDLVTVEIPVKVQNFLNPATVNVTVNGDEEKPLAAGGVYGWYNAQDNVLNKATINGCADSTAPYTTNYKIAYQTYQEFNDGKGIDDAEVQKGSFRVENGENDENEDVDYAVILSFIKPKTDPGIYYIEVWSKDDAGNENAPAVYTIKIDEAQPKITATFSSNENKNIKYYNYQRTVIVNVSDTSFDANDSFLDQFNVVFDFGKVGTNDGNAVAKTDWTFKNGTWTREYLIGNDANNGRGGKDGDDYMMTVSATDIAGNKVSTDNLGQMYYGSEDGKVLVKDYNAYSKHDISDFRMDQTAPVVTVSFSNNSARNTRYFNAGRVATITVIDHNFNFNNGKVAGVLIEAEGKSDNVPLNAGWVSKGNDTYVKTVEFLADANCTFKISVTDMAGNTTTDADQNAVYGNSVAPHDFVIDLTNPTLGVTGTNQTPYPDACTPGFTGNDTNISSANGSAEYTVQLTRTVREHKNQDVTNLFANINPNMGADIISVVYANIPDAAENDGIYTLNVSVTDLAGNSSQTSNTFTVNRHGSFYVFNDDLAKLVNDKFVQKADGKYSITEYNASPLVAGSVKIEIYRDGQLEKTIKPTVGAAVLGASGLYEYTYDLPAENFAQDGRYSISVSSEDEAKNMSDNTKLEESILEFTVDSVNPEIVIIKGLEKAIVNAEELEFTVNAVDTYGIKSIQIVVDGEVVKTFVPQEVYDQLKAEGKAMQQYEVMDENLDFTAAYTLYESNSKQSIEIVVTDMAGNSFTTASKDFAPVYDFHDSILVSTSFFARYIHNPVALVGTGIVIAGAVWLVLAKKKKTEDAAA